MIKSFIKTLIFSFPILFSLQITSNEINTLVFTKAESINDYSCRIPFKKVDRLMIVEGSLGDKKGNFIIDTGSESLILNNKHFETWPFYKKSNLPTSGVLSTIEETLEKRVKKITFQNLAISNKNAHLIDLSQIEKSKKTKILGIIGYNILKDYEVYIDLFLNQITLTKIDSNGEIIGRKPYLEKIVDTIKFKKSRHSIIIDTYVADIKLQFALDTGAEFNHLNTRVKKNVFKNFHPKSTVFLTGMSGKKIEVIYGKLHRLKLNKNNYFGPMKTIVTNLSNMSEAFGMHLDGVLGYDFFAQKRVIINYKKEQLYFINYPIMRS